MKTCKTCNIYICDIDGSRCFGMQPCKFYELKPIKVKVKKSKR